MSCERDKLQDIETSSSNRVCVITHQDVKLLTLLQLLSRLLEVTLPRCYIHIYGVDIDHVVSRRRMRLPTIDANVLASLKPLACVESG